MGIYDQIVAKIIREQESLMGPIAWQEAQKVDGLHINYSKNWIVSLDNNADGSSIVNKLVARYENLFGRAGREVCKEAVSALVADLKPSQIPISLK